MDVKNRHQAISKILMRAWRERWTEYQFGIQIKQGKNNIPVASFYSFIKQKYVY